MSAAWMPLYIGDYLRDTAHLSAAESGAYLHLIMHYWQFGCLPDDDRKLARIARMMPDEWMAARPTIEEFFQDGWRHKRIDAELGKADDKSGKAKAAAQERWKSKRNAPAEHPQCERMSERISELNAGGMLSQSQSDPESSLRSDIPQPSLRSGCPPTVELGLADLAHRAQIDHEIDSQPENLGDTGSVDLAAENLGDTAAGDGSPADASAKPPKRAKRRSRIAEDAQPDDRQRQDAAKAGLDQRAFRAEWQRFRDHHQAKGTLILDWQAAWRYWLGNSNRFNARAGPPQTKKPTWGDLAEQFPLDPNGLDERADRNETPEPSPGPTQSRGGGYVGPLQEQDRADPHGEVLDLEPLCANGR